MHLSERNSKKNGKNGRRMTEVYFAMLPQKEAEKHLCIFLYLLPLSFF